MIDTTHFPGAKKYWHMGKIHDWGEHQVHVMAHVLHYGSSVFEGIRAYETERGPAIFRLQEHIERLFVSAHAMNMEVPYSAEAIQDACLLMIRENRLRSAYIRPNLFYGYGNLGLTPRACPVELTIGCWEWGAYLGEAAIRDGVHILLLPRKRIHPTQMDASVKIGGLYVQSNIFATQARRMGYNEALFLNLENRISEGPGENIILVKDGLVKTNDKSESILEGITRNTIMELAADLGYKTEISPIEAEELFEADEVFFTGTAAEVTPITRITDSRDESKTQEDWPVHVIGNGKPGKTTLQLANLYADIVRGQVPEYHRWLSWAYETPKAAAMALNGHLADV